MLPTSWILIIKASSSANGCWSVLSPMYANLVKPCHPSIAFIFLFHLKMNSCCDDCNRSAVRSCEDGMSSPIGSETVVEAGGAFCNAEVRVRSSRVRLRVAFALRFLSGWLASEVGYADACVSCPSPEAAPGSPWRCEVVTVARVSRTTLFNFDLCSVLCAFCWISSSPPSESDST